MRSLSCYTACLAALATVFILAACGSSDDSSAGAGGAPAATGGSGSLPDGGTAGNSAGGANPGAGGTSPNAGGSNPGAGGDPGVGGSDPGAGGDSGVGGANPGTGGDPGTGGSGTVPCDSSAQCAVGSFCEKTACDASTGVCTVLPSSCNNEYEPSCGCNGVSYWNACERRRVAQSAASDSIGRCSKATALHCLSTADCAAVDGLAVCAPVAFQFTPDQCAMPETACWYLPDTCPATSYDKVRACYNSQCTNICEGLKDSLNHTTYAYDSTCQ